MKPMMITVFVALSASAYAGPNTESLKIVPGDLAQNDHFGTSIAFSDGIVAVGARLHDEPTTNDGAAYLYNASTGAQLLKLLVTDSFGGGNFGSSIALDMHATPPLVVVGKDRDRENGIDSGSVYLFNASSGAFINKFAIGDGGDLFGTDVATEDGLVVIGAMQNNVRGSVTGRAFLIDAGTGFLAQTLEPDSPVTNSLFGNSVGISGDLVIVGARREPAVGSNSGVAYLFDVSSGDQLARIFPADGSFGDQFGYSVAISGNIAAISAIVDGDNGAGSGSVYIYDVSTPSVPVMIDKLLAPDGMPGDELGYRVDIQNSESGYRVVAGAWRRDEGADETGAVYVFDLNASGVLQSTSKLIASDGSEDAFLGSGVAIDDTGDIAAGASDDNASFSNGGAAYIFELGTTTACPADLNNDGSLNFFDVSAFLTAYQSQDPIADFNNDGLFNFFDVSAFLTAFNAGCP